MPRFLSFALLAAPLLFTSNFASAQSDGAPSEISLGATVAKPQPDPTFIPEADPIAPNSPHMERQTRFEIIRDFETQLVYARTAFPMGTKGLLLRQGVITPSGDELQSLLNLWGPAVKPGDPAHISFVQIRNDHIRFEINGGPILRKKWYQRVQVSGANGPVTQTDAPQNNPHGSYVDVYFDKYVPEM